MKTPSKTQKFRPFFSRNCAFTRYLSVLLAFAVINLSLSCSYYSVKDVPVSAEAKEVSSQIKEFNASKKYVIVHSDGLSWHLKNMIINDDNQVIEGTIEPVNSRHTSIKPRDSKRVHRYVATKTEPINEIHIYLKSSSVFEDSRDVAIPLSDIKRLSYNDKNVGRSVLNVVGGTIGTAFVFLLIAAALKSSCPFVYIKNGDEYVFAGELYPGTITPKMQEYDYLPLPNFKSQDNMYTIKISNELKEIQYTDQLQLIRIDHKRNEKVLLDINGNIQTFRNIQLPVNCYADNINDQLDSVKNKDDVFFTFDSPKATSDATRSIVFDFERQEGQNKAKLFLTAKNSVWLDYVFGKFNEQFGWYYNTFQKEQQQLEKKIITDWVEGQNIPLSVYIKNGTDWELVEKINSVGPLATRDIAIPIDLSEIKGKKVEVKLVTGFMFWELDYIGIDYTPNSEVEIRTLDLESAIDQDGNDVANLLLNADGEYFIQPNMRDEVVVSFRASADARGPQATSVFLKNKGYYNYIRDYRGIPDREKLESFREDHAFTKFSEKRYFDFVNYSESKLVYHE